MTSSDQPEPIRFVAYFRVSTKAQGQSGLGMGAQQAAVDGYLATLPDAEIVASFTEVESGKRYKRAWAIASV